MLPLLLSFVILVSSVNSARIKSLMDLPLTMPKGSYMIHATLTDKGNGNKYFMQEFISSGEAIKGMIVIDTPKNTFNVYYHLKDTSAKDNYERLLILGTNCSLYKFKSSARTKRLPEINKRLTSLLLAMGPSILYRIDHSSISWKQRADENVRGTIMKSFTTTTVNKKLDITYYYKSNLDPQSGLQQPSRIVFNGTDPSYPGSSIKETLILDIYLQEMDLKNDFTQIVHPTPGIGCPVYYEAGKSIPTMNTHIVHMILSETVEGPTTTQTVSEIYAYDKLKLLRLKTSILGISTEALYDYSLGIVNIFQDGGSCNIVLAEITSPGIDQSSGQFSLRTLLALEGKFNYLGKLYLENRPGFVVEAWESIQYDAITANGKCDKVVTTQYFAETTSADAFNGYMIVSTIINCYKLDSSKTNYQLTETVKRDYIDFQTSEVEFHDKFSLAGCDYFTGDMTLTFQLGCTGWDCIKFAEDHIYELKEQFRDSILLNYDLTPLRLSEMDVNFRTSSIDIRVDILEAPNLQNIFVSKTMFVSDESLKLLSRTEAPNELGCINHVSTNYEKFDVVIYCPVNNVCGTMNGIKNVKKDNKKGQACQVIQVPLHNLRRLSREIVNKDLQSSLIRDTAYKTISLKHGHMDPVGYKVVDIIDETQDKTKEQKSLFSLFYSGASLNAQDLNVVTVPNVNTFGDCYRACASSDELECRTLSYCSDPKSPVCLVTNVTIVKAKVGKKNDPSCSIYMKNYLLDYSVIQNRRFKVSASISQELGVDKCASQCSETQDCFSFQSCGQTCILSGHYTDSSTEYHDGCKIYIPKVSEKYKTTGRKLVSDTFHVEFNLNLNECAAFCYNWNSCQSFNFCPKGRSTSTCSLSKYSVKGSKTTTTDATNCFNYEIINSNSNKNKQSTSTSTNKKGTNGSTAFAIIMIFLATGFLFGIGLTVAYLKVKTLTHWNNRASRSDQRFIWTRQVDVQTENELDLDLDKHET